MGKECLKMLVRHLSPRNSKETNLRLKYCYKTLRRVILFGWCGTSRLELHFQNPQCTFELGALWLLFVRQFQPCRILCVYLCSCDGNDPILLVRCELKRSLNQNQLHPMGVCNSFSAKLGAMKDKMRHHYQDSQE